MPFAQATKKEIKLFVEGVNAIENSDQEICTYQENKDEVKGGDLEIHLNYLSEYPHLKYEVLEFDKVSLVKHWYESPKFKDHTSEANYAVFNNGYKLTNQKQVEKLIWENNAQFQKLIGIAHLNTHSRR